MHRSAQPRIANLGQSLYSSLQMVEMTRYGKLLSVLPLDIRLGRKIRLEFAPRRRILQAKALDLLPGAKLMSDPQESLSNSRSFSSQRPLGRPSKVSLGLLVPQIQGMVAGW